MLMLFIYLFLWILSISTSSWFTTWILLEALNWLLLSYANSQMALIFIVWQSWCSFWMLAAWALLSSSTMTLISMMMKAGMPPFHGWITTVKWTWTSLTLFLTLHKTLPFMMMVSIMDMNLICVMWLVVGFVSLYGSMGWTNMMWASSLSESMWMCLTSTWEQFWVYNLTYCALWSAWMMSSRYYNLSHSAHFFQSLLFILMIGLPPFSIFFLKMTVWMTMSPIMAIMTGLLSWLMVFMYFIWVSLALYKGSLLSTPYPVGFTLMVIILSMVVMLV